jgi:hypothetical protein
MGLHEIIWAFIVNCGDKQYAFDAARLFRDESRIVQCSAPTSMIKAWDTYHWPPNQPVSYVLIVLLLAGFIFFLEMFGQWWEKGRHRKGMV